MAEITDPVPTTTVLENESPQEKLTDLTARATALYAVKKYEEAAELYSQATEIQADINGEMAEDNADLLFAYGRCLFYVAQKTSTVLGGTAASAQLKGNEKKPSKKRKANGAIKSEAGPSTTSNGDSASAQVVTETTQPADIIPAEDVKPEESKPSSTDKPFFHIEGDAAGWDDSDEEDVDEEQAEGEEEEDEEEDDFNTSFEILDLSRVLYLRKLESLTSKQPPPEDLPSQLTHLNTRLSEVYDLQAEISLEGEKYSAAVTDLRACLELKLKLYEPDNALLAECHYKLSLALEVASQIQDRDAEGNPIGEIKIDWPMRNEAASEQAKAIESCKLRIEKETKALEALPTDKDKEKIKAQENIDDVQDMIQAMEQRLEELKKPPVSVKAEAEKDANAELMGTVLGQLLGTNGSGASSSSAEERKAKLAEIVSGANDLTGMIKKKKAKPVPVAVEQPEVNGKGKGKRSIDEVEEESSEVVPEREKEVKKVRIEDVID